MSATVRRERRSKDWETGEGGGDSSPSSLRVVAAPEEPTSGVFSVGSIFRWTWSSSQLRVTLTVGEKKVRSPSCRALSYRRCRVISGGPE